MWEMKSMGEKGREGNSRKWKRLSDGKRVLPGTEAEGRTEVSERGFTVSWNGNASSRPRAGDGV